MRTREVITIFSKENRRNVVKVVGEFGKLLREQDIL